MAAAGSRARDEPAEAVRRAPLRTAELDLTKSRREIDAGDDSMGDILPL
jgi:hypothetical protein